MFELCIRTPKLPVSNVDLMYMFNGAIGTGLLVPRGQCVVAISNICDEGRTSKALHIYFSKSVRSFGSA